MGLELGNDALGRVRDLLIPTIAASKFFGRRVWFDSSSVEPITRRVLDTLNKKKRKFSWLTNDALTTFFEERLEEYLATAAFDSEAFFADVSASNEAADVLTRALETLPWSYYLLIPTPIGDDVAGPDEIRLDDTFCLTRYSMNAVARFPTTEAEQEAEAELMETAGILPGRYYLRGSVSGYIRRSQPTTDIDELVHAFKGLLGLALVKEDLVFNLVPSRSPNRPIGIIVYRSLENGRLVALPHKWLTLDDSAIVHRLHVRGPRGWDDAAELIHKIADAFADAATRSSARWFLDSYGDAHGLVQIVQATISLEILLGDQAHVSELGIASLLGNRLAYLIGHTPTMRRRILADFKRLYDIRSKIVHSGKATLNDDERLALVELQRYAYQAISAQIDGLRAERESET